MGFLSGSWALYLRLLRATRRMPTWVVMSIIQPMLWLVFFGQLFRQVVELPGFATHNYAQYLAPGIAVMTALFGAAFTGIGLLADVDSGFLDRLLATPVSRGAVIAARVLMAATQVAVQATVILLAATALGAQPGGGPLGILLVYLAACLLAAGFAAFSCALALLTRRQEMIIALTNLLVLPLIYTSSTMMVPDLMPPWIRAAARLNPVDWAVVTGRTGYAGGPLAAAAAPLALLAGFAVLCLALATRAFTRYQRSL
jgi:ABC-2 type transport system permease protein